MSTPPASLALMPPVISLNKAFSLALHKGCSAEVLEMLQNELSAQSSVINGKIACKFRYITTDIKEAHHLSLEWNFGILRWKERRIRTTVVVTMNSALLERAIVDEAFGQHLHRFLRDGVKNEFNVVVVCDKLTVLEDLAKLPYSFDDSMVMFGIDELMRSSNSLRPSCSVFVGRYCATLGDFREGVKAFSAGALCMVVHNPNCGEAGVLDWFTRAPGRGWEHRLTQDACKAVGFMHPVVESQSNDTETAQTAASTPVEIKCTLGGHGCGHRSTQDASQASGFMNPVVESQSNKVETPQSVQDSKSAAVATPIEVKWISDSASAMMSSKDAIARVKALKSQGKMIEAFDLIASRQMIQGALSRDFIQQVRASTIKGTSGGYMDFYRRAGALDDDEWLARAVVDRPARPLMVDEIADTPLVASMQIKSSAGDEAPCDVNWTTDSVSIRSVSAKEAIARIKQLRAQGKVIEAFDAIATRQMAQGCLTADWVNLVRKNTCKGLRGGYLDYNRPQALDDDAWLTRAIVDQPEKPMSTAAILGNRYGLAGGLPKPDYSYRAFEQLGNESKDCKETNCESKMDGGTHAAWRVPDEMRAGSMRSLIKAKTLKENQRLIDEAVVLLGNSWLDKLRRELSLGNVKVTFCRGTDVWELFWRTEGGQHVSGREAAVTDAIMDEVIRLVVEQLRVADYVVTSDGKGKHYVALPLEEPKHEVR